MKVAVTYENGQVFQHFGHTEEMKFYDITDGVIVSSKVVSTNGSGHGALAGFLKDNGVDTLICGGIGGGARNALVEANITLYPGVSGDADTAVKALLSETLNFNPDTVCNHHHDVENESHCRTNGCGSHEHHCGSN